MAGVHEDFGEKIGGAKKDLWKDRGLYADDLEAMNEREADKFVKKDNVWKKPDYAVMLEEGIPFVSRSVFPGCHPCGNTEGKRLSRPSLF